eukprot:g3110.t1
MTAKIVATFKDAVAPPLQILVKVYNGTNEEEIETVVSECLHLPSKVLPDEDALPRKMSCFVENIPVNYNVNMDQIMAPIIVQTGVLIPRSISVDGYFDADQSAKLNMQPRVTTGTLNLSVPFDIMQRLCGEKAYSYDPSTGSQRMILPTNRIREFAPSILHHHFEQPTHVVPAKSSFHCDSTQSCRMRNTIFTGVDNDSTFLLFGGKKISNLPSEKLDACFADQAPPLTTSVHKRFVQNMSSNMYSNLKMRPVETPLMPDIIEMIESTPCESDETFIIFNINHPSFYFHALVDGVIPLAHTISSLISSGVQPEKIRLVSAQKWPHTKIPSFLLVMLERLTYLPILDLQNEFQKHTCFVDVVTGFYPTIKTSSEFRGAVEFLKQRIQNPPLMDVTEECRLPPSFQELLKKREKQSDKEWRPLLLLAQRKLRANRNFDSQNDNSKKPTRVIVNIDQVVTEAMKLNFEPFVVEFEDLTVCQQIKIMEEGNAFISTFGSQWANAVFMKSSSVGFLVYGYGFRDGCFYQVDAYAPVSLLSGICGENACGSFQNDSPTFFFNDYCLSALRVFPSLMDHGFYFPLIQNNKSSFIPPFQFADERCSQDIANSVEYNTCVAEQEQNQQRAIQDPRWMWDKDRRLAHFFFLNQDIELDISEWREHLHTANAILNSQRHLRHRKRMKDYDGKWVMMNNNNNNLKIAMKAVLTTLMGDKGRSQGTLVHALKQVVPILCYRMLAFANKQRLYFESCLNAHSASFMVKQISQEDYNSGLENLVTTAEEQIDSWYQSMSPTDRVVEIEKARAYYWSARLSIQPFHSPATYSLLGLPRLGRSKNAVMGYATNYGIVTLKRFVRSLRNTGYMGDIVLAVDNPSEDVQRYLYQEGVISVDISLDAINLDANLDSFDKVRVPRFRKYQEWAQFYPDGIMLMTDTRDVFFQSHPFPSEIENIFFPRTNSDSPPQSSIELAFFEEDSRMTIAKCKYNRDWVISCWGEDMLEKIGSNPILCSGTIYATAKGIMRYTTAMLEEANTMYASPAGVSQKEGQHGKACRNDQAYHNVLFYTGKFSRLDSESHSNIKVFSQGNGVVNTLGYVIALGDSPLDSEGFVVQSDGITRSPVVHQYDRNLELVNWVHNKFVHTLTPNINASSFPNFNSGQELLIKYLTLIEEKIAT